MGGDIKTDNVASFLDGFIDGEPLYPDRSEFQSIMAENMEEVKGGEEHEVSDEILDTDYENGRFISASLYENMALCI
ncbi:hypothetical protein DPMN_088724 [Dreissena polymorpha]|uniref:Uncharacterized protein n=1 Tax=Dreissena polymorpha TaxID=45954 RepID=A0A9D4KVH7_DREPO|nr:hypothetical protein DPMN_088724 [Dreissena polymorpha]